MSARKVSVVLAVVALALCATTAAHGQAFSWKVPVTFEVGLPSGDVIQASGELHNIYSFIWLPTWGWKWMEHSQPQGVMGVVISGPNLGVKYTGTGVSQFIWKSTTFNWERTAVYRFDWQGQGRAPNLKVHVTVHETYSAMGELTADVEKYEVTFK